MVHLHFPVLSSYANLIKVLWFPPLSFKTFPLYFVTSCLNNTSSASFRVETSRKMFFPSKLVK